MASNGRSTEPRFDEKCSCLSRFFLSFHAMLVARPPAPLQFGVAGLLCERESGREEKRN